jgi:hypothetical protein
LAEYCAPAIRSRCQDSHPPALRFLRCTLHSSCAGLHRTLWPAYPHSYSPSSLHLLRSTRRTGHPVIQEHLSLTDGVAYRPVTVPLCSRLESSSSSSSQQSARQHRPEQGGRTLSSLRFRVSPSCSLLLCLHLLLHFHYYCSCLLRCSSSSSMQHHYRRVYRHSSGAARSSIHTS